MVIHTTTNNDYKNEKGWYFQFDENAYGTHHNTMSVEIKPNWPGILLTNPYTYTATNELRSQYGVLQVCL